METVEDLITLRRTLRKYIGCPVDWPTILKGRDFSMVVGLRYYWKKIAESLQTDSEMDNYRYMEFRTRGCSIDVRAMEHNDPYWRPKAVSAYLEKVGFLQEFKFKPPEETDHKHHAFKELSRTAVVKKSIDSSMFYSDVTVERLEMLMWSGIEQCWPQLAIDRPLHMFVQTTEPLGASEGKETYIVRFDLDYSNCEAHAHPRLPNKIPAGARILDEDGWQPLFPDDEEGERMWDYAETIDDDIEIEV